MGYRDHATATLVVADRGLDARGGPALSRRLRSEPFIEAHHGLFFFPSMEHTEKNVHRLEKIAPIMHAATSRRLPSQPEHGKKNRTQWESEPT